MKDIDIVDEHTLIRDTVGYEMISKIDDVFDIPEVLKFLKIVDNYNKMTEALKKEEKAKTITEDDAKDGLDQIQKLTDAKVKQIDELKAVKEKDVLEV